MLKFLAILAILSTTAAFSKGIDSIDSLRSFLTAHPEMDRIDQVLPNFSEEVRGNFLRMYNSPSLQGASHDFPRVIMSSKDAKFIVAFNGDPSQKGYDRLEAFEFDDATETWRPFSRFFAGDTAAMKTYAQTHKLPVPVTPTMSCVECHRSRLRPNWDDYSINPGLVHDGGFDSQREEDGNKKFLEQHLKQHPRYKHLIANGDMLGDNGFGTAVTALNYKRIARIIEGLPDIQKMKYAVIAAFGGCDDMDSFIPLNAKANGLMSPGDMQKDQIERGSAYVKSKLARKDFDLEYILPKRGFLVNPYGPDFVGSEEATWVGVAKVRFVMQWLGEDMEDWSTAFSKGAFAFRAPGTRFVPHDKRPWGQERYDKEVNPTHFVYMLGKRLGLEGEMYDSTYKATPPRLGRIDCAALKAKSLAALEGWKPKLASQPRQQSSTEKPSHQGQ